MELIAASPDVLLSNLPAFEKQFLLTLSEATKETLFSSIFDKYKKGMYNFVQTRKKCIRRLIEALILEIYEFHNEIFIDLSCQIAKQIAKTTQIRTSESGSKLTYGEVDYFSFVSILDKLGPKAGDVFVDLGHGTGKALCIASLLFGNLFKTLVGIEIIPELNAASVEVRNKILDLYERVPLFSEHTTDIRVYEGDFTKSDSYDWTSADIIFANSVSHN